MAQNIVQALCIEISVAVQGVGFRPFVYRLGKELGLAGYVCNSSLGITIIIEGPQESLNFFLQRLKTDAPALALIQKIITTTAIPKGYTTFMIADSQVGFSLETIALPDIATCAECRQEIFDPTNRRYLYPFTNCTFCGPRYSILNSLPYDRARTSMKEFKMCADCQQEYSDPENRRFHAQPNACHNCGPRLELWSTNGVVLEKDSEALKFAAEIIRSGKILALKGLGGFQLLVDAGNDGAVATLRQRKHRQEKPFALLFPSINSVQQYCRVSQLEESLLLSSQSPIVLLSRIPYITDFYSAAAGNPYLGAMLAYTPLHHMLMALLNSPVIATSGNISDEPICIDEYDALKRLGNIADFFLVHNRPIVRPMDDSLVRVIEGKTCVLRRARGYAPLPIMVAQEQGCVLGLGAHYKNTIALKVKRNVFLSQHIGDLETTQSITAFNDAVENLNDLYAPAFLSFACDRHPEYMSTKYAQKSGKQFLQVQHHHSHIVSCMAEHHIQGEVLGLAWDGTGLGDDGTSWGGEFLLCT